MLPNSGEQGIFSWPCCEVRKKSYASTRDNMERIPVATETIPTVVSKSGIDPDWRKRPRKSDGFNSPEGYVRERELANMLGVNRRTIRRWELFRQGPPRTKIGRQVYYRVEAVYEWMRTREQQPRRRIGGRA